MVREAKKLVEKGKIGKLNILMLNIFKIGLVEQKLIQKMQKENLNGKLIIK